VSLIGIDIGGSSARVGVVSGGGIAARETVPTGYEIRAVELLDALRAAIERLGTPDAIGVGMPGLQDSEGRVKDASNLPKLNGVAIARELAATWNCPYRMDNDLNVLALGEARYGGHVGTRILTVALGTGIGAAMTVDARCFVRPRAVLAILDIYWLIPSARDAGAARRAAWKQRSRDGPSRNMETPMSLTGSAWVWRLSVSSMNRTASFWAARSARAEASPSAPLLRSAWPQSANHGFAACRRGFRF